MVFLRVHRRAASVPVGDPGEVDDTSLLAARNSYLFSRAAIDNADALSSASKRHDQQFLSDINNRIGSAPFSQPVFKPIKRAHVVVHGSNSPSFTPRRRSIAVSSVLRPPLVTDSNDDDVDVDYEVKLIAPLTNRLAKYGGRATSVPPLTGGVGRSAFIYSTDRGYNNYPEGHYILTGHDAEFHHTPLIYETPRQISATVPTFQKLNPVADLAVRQAHRNLDRIEREIKTSGDVIISRPISPRSVLYTASTDGPWRRSLSYHGPRSSTVRVRSPSPAGRPSASRSYHRTSYARPPAPVLSDEELFEYLSPAKLNRNVKTELLLSGANPDLYVGRIHHHPPPPPPARRPVGRSAGLTDVLLYDLHLNSPRDIVLNPVTASSNILKKVSSGSTPLLIHSSTHHTLPLHHPLTTPYVATITPVTLTHSLPKPYLPPVTLKPIPSAPVTTSIPSGLPPVVRPRVSETRRKVRDVLCKVKGDPNYFDY